MKEPFTYEQLHEEIRQRTALAEEARVRLEVQGEGA